MAFNINTEAEFEILFRADANDFQEICLRRGTAVALGGFSWLGGGALVLAIWGITFVLLDMLYVHLLRATPRPATARRFWMCFGASAAVGICAAIAPLLFILAFGEKMLFVASCAVVAFALHTLSRNTEISLSAILGLGMVFFGATSITVYEFYVSTSVWMKGAIAFAGVAVQLFYLLSFRQILRDKAMLSESLELEAQSEKMKSLGQLTSGIAHDFNNLLTVIGGNIELAQTRENDEKSKSYLEDALGASRRAAALVSRLLAYARKSTLRSDEIDLTAVVHNLTSGLLSVLPANVDLDVQVGDAPVLITADQSMLESAVLNLVINARDAIGATPGNISIAVARDTGTEFARLCVTDSGPGMTPDELARAEEPFFTTKPVGQGSGLGLSMVSGFAEQTGGTFELVNRPEGGLRASLLLPRLII